MIKKIYRLYRKMMIGRPSKRLYKFMITDWIKLKDLDSCKKVLETKRFNRNLQPLVIEYPEGKNILVVAPHPDDDIIGAGGTLLKAKNNGSQDKLVSVAPARGARPGQPKESEQRAGRVCPDEGEAAGEGAEAEERRPQPHGAGDEEAGVDTRGTGERGEEEKG